MKARKEKYKILRSYILSVGAREDADIQGDIKRNCISRFTNVHYLLTNKRRKVKVNDTFETYRYYTDYTDYTYIHRYYTVRGGGGRCY